MRGCILLLLLLPTCFFGQTPSFDLTRYQESTRVEKLYVAHDKPFYIPGDIIWTKIWLINGITHERLESDELVYVDWIDPDGNVILNDIVELKKGEGDFSIETERELSTGDYVLRVYTYYQLNFNNTFIFQKPIKLINGQEAIVLDSIKSKGSYNVQVFPEGGYLINDITSRVAFEVRNTNNPIDGSSVQIVDDSNQVIGSTQTNQNGVGVFSLKPTLGKKYYLLIDEQQKIDIPKCLVAGAVMELDATDADDVDLIIEFSESIKNQVFKVVAHVRGVEVLNLAANTSGTFNYTIDRSILPSGVIHFTLFDAYNRPISERLIFNENLIDEVEVDIRVSKETYERGKTVDGEVSTVLNDTVIPSSLIMSVYNANLIDLELNEIDIRNYLLLQSDIDQPITNLASYFNNEGEDYLINMDLLMMTQYWRRFNWLTIEHLVESVNLPSIEDSYTIIGKVVNRYTKKPVKANVILTAMNQKGNFVNTSHATEDDGLFVFRGLDLRDTTDIFIQAGTYRKPRKKIKIKDNVEIRGSREVEVEWIRYERNPINMNMTYSSLLDSFFKVEKQRQAEVIEAKTYISSYDLEGEDWSIDLASVTISAQMNKAQQRDQNIRNRYEELGLIFVPRSEKHEVPIQFLEDSYHVDIFEVIARIVPSAQTMFVDGQKTISTGKSSVGKSISKNRNALETTPPGEPLILVNGQRLERGLVAQVDPESLLYIDVIIGIEALTLYNSKRTVYNLLLRSDVKMFEQKVSGKKSISFPGYHTARTFYRRANVSPDNQNGKDYSTTLFWNPDIRIDDEPFSFSIATADLPGRHCVYIQGLTDSGVPFVQKKYFVVE